MRSIIEVFLEGQWVQAAEFEPYGRYEASFEYLPEYVFSESARPISFSLPLSMERLGLNVATGHYAPCPAFLLDLVPQGRGRQFLLRETGLQDREESDLHLAQYGAYNPIGNLRLDTAVRFFEAQHAQREGHATGYELDDIFERKEAFLEHIWLHSMLSAGTTGVQGAAPKFLLTQDQRGRWFADAALPDTEAETHWLVKLPRGTHETDYTVLRNENAYLEVARKCGLRTIESSFFKSDMLFLRRFDRLHQEGRVHRLHQETLASLSGIRGFGIPVSLFDLIEGFLPHVHDPGSEVIEFIRRDILNTAMRNTDNHARNTSVQRLPDGRVQLTPIYDFAPMYMDRELIVRSCKWSKGGREIHDWQDILDQLPLKDSQKRVVLESLRSFASTTLCRLSKIMEECDVDQMIIEQCQPAIEAQIERLERS